MKKRIILTIIAMCVILLIGAGIWLYISREKSTTLYQAKSDFVLSEDTTILNTKLATSESLYESIDSTDSRITILLTVINKLNSFEADLTSQVVSNNTKSSKINKLNKGYKKLANEREDLIKYCDTYIISMTGNTAADGTWAKDLYNNLFNHTVNYIKNYCSNLEASSDYVFTKINTASQLKHQLYRLYIYSVKDALENINNYQFGKTFALTTFNSLITLNNGNFQLKESLIGGEYSEQALKFVNTITKCDMSTFVKNLEANYNSIINDTAETPAEKLATLYLKQILGV